MLYQFLKIILRIAVVLFFRKRYKQGLHQLETKEPLLVCMNHPNSFLDAMIVMVACKRPFHVLVRADVFKHPLVNKFLRSINLIPIYRMKDGYNQLEKNNETFNECNKVLEQKGAIIIFPEASCVLERRLRKIQKGASKIAFAAEEKNNFSINLSCVCVGNTYERLSRFGGFLHIQTSKPFLVSEYKDYFLLDKNEGYKKLSDRIEKDLREQLCVIEKNEDEYLFESYCLLQAQVTSDFKHIKAYSERINTADNELKETLSTVTKDYFEVLKKYSIHPAFLQELSFSKWKSYYLLAIRTFDMLFLLPIFLLGLFANGIAFFLPEYIAKKVFPDEPEFYSSINVAGSGLLFLMVYLIYAIVILILFQSLFVCFTILILFIFSGFIAFMYNRRRMLLVSSFQYHIKCRKAVRDLSEHTQTLIRELKQL